MLKYIWVTWSQKERMVTHVVTFSIIRHRFTEIPQRTDGMAVEQYTPAARWRRGTCARASRRPRGTSWGPAAAAGRAWPAAPCARASAPPPWRLGPGRRGWPPSALRLRLRGWPRAATPRCMCCWDWTASARKTQGRLATEPGNLLSKGSNGREGGDAHTDLVRLGDRFRCLHPPSFEKLPLAGPAKEATGMAVVRGGGVRDLPLLWTATWGQAVDHGPLQKNYAENGEKSPVRGHLHWRASGRALLVKYAPVQRIKEGVAVQAGQCRSAAGGDAPPGSTNKCQVRSWRKMRVFTRMRERSVATELCNHIFMDCRTRANCRHTAPG